MSDTGAPLSDGEAAQMRAWVVAANRWGVAAQTLVGAASELATASCDLADRLDPGRRSAEDGSSRDGLASLAGRLRLLADAVEHDSRELREGYLTTAASLEEYRSVLD
jgi:hypothetical protein